jgi:glycolate oxidase iron-sulfur subunit
VQTNLADFIAGTPEGERAESILRSCVHCGFCTATCPTYQLLGDELDGPRGRIYLIKQVLEGEQATAITRDHLDRCLTCRSCESTCPSGVRYGELVDIGRHVVDELAPRSMPERALRAAIRFVFSSPSLFGTALSLGRMFAPVLPARLRESLHTPKEAGTWPPARHARRMMVLPGCVQPSMGPRINAASARVLDALGISLIEGAGSSCCGAIHQHLSAPKTAEMHARMNVDTWHQALEDGVETIVMTASGCGSMVRDYARLLAHDPDYAARAQRVCDAVRDIGEVISNETLDAVAWDALNTRRVAYHPPCTLQHGQKLPGLVEGVLRRLGVQLTPVADSHLCCGSAGTYSLLQPEISRTLRGNKLANLEAGEPAEIVTANIGCLHHLQGGTTRSVRHWIELLDDALPAQK